MSESEENESQPIPDAQIDEALAEIPHAAAAESAKTEPEEAISVVRYQAEKLQIENDGLRDELEAAKDVHALRKEYIPKLFYLTVGWLSTVLVFVGLVARGIFVLSDKVLIALITSTTVSVIGIFMLAAKWLFPHKKDQP